MRLGRITGILVLSFSAMFFVSGCTPNSADDQRARDEKTRDDVARATERAKPALEEAGRKIGDAAAAAADEAQAAAEGVREGWNRGAHATPVNVNSASEDELVSGAGINHGDARRIVEGRPYRDKHEMVSKGVISEATYEKIRDRITAK